MDFEKPLVSIITVSFNAASSIEKTILSIINQTYSNIEFINFTLETFQSFNESLLNFDL